MNVDMGPMRERVRERLFAALRKDDQMAERFSWTLPTDRAIFDIFAREKFFGASRHYVVSDPAQLSWLTNEGISVTLLGDAPLTTLVIPPNVYALDLQKCGPVHLKFSGDGLRELRANDMVTLDALPDGLEVLSYPPRGDLGALPVSLRILRTGSTCTVPPGSALSELYYSYAWPTDMRNAPRLEKLVLEATPPCPFDWPPAIRELHVMCAMDGPLRPPDTVHDLKIYGPFDSDIHFGAASEAIDIHISNRSEFNSTIQPYPAGLHCVAFGDNYDKELRGLDACASCLVSLHLGETFNRPLDLSGFANLSHLYLGRGYASAIVMPPTLSNLYITSERLSSEIQLPATLCHLACRESITEWLLPPPGCIAKEIGSIVPGLTQYRFIPRWSRDFLGAELPEGDSGVVLPVESDQVHGDGLQ